MATDTLGADSAHVTLAPNPQPAGATDHERTRELYRRYKFARACWDAKIYDPELGGADLPDEVERPLLEADHAALIAFMKAPAGSRANLITKLETILAECLCEPEFVMAVLRDVEALPIGGARG